MPTLNFEKGKLEIKNKEGEKAELIIFGEIASSKWDDKDVEPQDVKDLLNEIGDKDIDIYINSPGGNVFAGMAIYNMLKRHKGHKKVFVEGYAASISSVIAMVGDEIVIPENAYIMIHKAWGLAVGNADDLRERADLYERFDSTIANAYLSRATEGQTEEKFLEMMKNETWLNGKEAKEYFKVILGEEDKAAACLEGELYKNYKLPQNLLINALNKKNNNYHKGKEKHDFESPEISKAKLELLLNTI